MDPFATLGLAPRYDLDKAELERRYRDLQQALHPDKHTSASSSERTMTLRKAVEVNEAYRVLRDDSKRAEALLAALDGANAKPAHEIAPQALLLDMMELRESLAEARAARDAKAVACLAEQVAGREREVRAELVTAFAALAAEAQTEVRERTQALISRLRYYRRFLDEVAAFEDEALS
jgi:molecular chaperone HscB